MTVSHSNTPRGYRGENPKVFMAILVIHCCIISQLQMTPYYLSCFCGLTGLSRVLVIGVSPAFAIRSQMGSQSSES